LEWNNYKNSKQLYLHGQCGWLKKEDAYVPCLYRLHVGVVVHSCAMLKFVGVVGVGGRCMHILQQCKHVC